MALRGTEYDLISEANLNRPGHQVDPEHARRDIARLRALGRLGRADGDPRVVESEPEAVVDELGAEAVRGRVVGEALLDRRCRRVARNPGRAARRRGRAPAPRPRGSGRTRRPQARAGAPGTRWSSTTTRDRRRGSRRGRGARRRQLASGRRGRARAGSRRRRLRSACARWRRGCASRRRGESCTRPPRRVLPRPPRLFREPRSRRRSRSKKQTSKPSRASQMDPGGARRGVDEG